MADYIQVTEDENDPDATIELPAELPSPEGASILLSTIVAQFPGATGLKYRNPESGTMRGLRVVEGRVMAPDGVWQNHLYVVTFPKENKRKGDDTRELPVGKTRKTDDRRTSDLIVLGLDFSTTVEGMKDYFSQYGELVMTQLKKDPKGKSKGFGFIRYRDVESQNAVNNKRHKIDDRWCEVKYPDSQQPEKRKLFVGRLSPDIKEDDLYQYFAKIGTVTDVFIPKEFRGFAFVTLESAQIAQGLIGQDHIINGNSVLINYADPKNKQGQNPHQQGGRPPFGNRDGGGFSHGGRGGYQNDYFRNKQGGGGGNDGSGSGSYGGGGYNNMNSSGQGQMIPNNPQGGGGGMGNPAAAAMGMLNPQGNMNQNQLNQAVLAAALNQAGLGMVGSLLMGGGAGMNALQAQATMAQTAQAQGNQATTPQTQNNPAITAESTAYQAQQQAAAMGWGAGNPAQGAGDGTGGQFYGAGNKQASGW
ncbi:TAR DNA-binding protein 43-like [Lytechinus pictus]|uniref:TAR DNA-binding protein 43-like n=1 Tax=Lytechinus pictus TaxID=7653 RepID=UPI00240D3FAE|nr:TAR DNA-binding protein 43-like [Lytechinus pictus]